MDVEEARSLALNGFKAEEYDHFGKPAYRIKAKRSGGKPGRTFMTLWIDEGHAFLMLNIDQQAELVTHQPSGFEPHPSEWGAKGGTIAQLKQLNGTMFRQALDPAVHHASR
jgi:hypothetical protein